MTIRAGAQHERIPPKLRVFRPENEQTAVTEPDIDPDPDPGPDGGMRLLNIDDYWAGRNRATRRSARAAA